MSIEISPYRKISLAKQFLRTQWHMIFHVHQLYQHIHHPDKPQNMQNRNAIGKILQNVKLARMHQCQTDTEYQRQTTSNQFHDIGFSHGRNFSSDTIGNHLCIIFYHFYFIHIFCSFQIGSTISPYIIVSQFYL